MAVVDTDGRIGSVEGVEGGEASVGPQVDPPKKPTFISKKRVFSEMKSIGRKGVLTLYTLYKARPCHVSSGSSLGSHYAADQMLASAGASASAAAIASDASWSADQPMLTKIPADQNSC